MPRFASVHDTVSLGAAALKAIEEFVKVSRAAIYLVDPRKKDQLELVFAKGMNERDRLEAEKALVSGYPERCFRTQRYIERQGAQAPVDRSFPDRQGAQAPVDRSSSPDELPPNCAIYQPVMSGEVCVGCFALFENSTIPLTDDQRLGLSIVGEICGLTYRQLTHALFACEISEERCKLAETKVREQQKALVLSARMSAFGKMASGIGHEINNPLTVIYGKVAQITDLAENDQLEANTVLASMEKIDAMASRIAKIISGMRTVVREGVNDTFSPECVRNIVEDTIMFCNSKFKTKGVNLIVSEIPDSLSIDCSASQLAQVLLNLLGNAYDAVIDLPEKWIKLEVEDQGANIELAILDSGKGINPDVSDRIFDTFFTTKAPGAGTGLGLSISLGIIEGHNGTIWLDKDCANTRFVLRLPKKQAKMVAA
ncbi:MAG: GHKL domain-containing protein [Deltaproteobacteria bacterium]|nr:GHKL domain-containing protein [Deltaproteobacteria bacterium]